MPTRLLLLDGDTLIHQATETWQHETWWPGSPNLRTAACDVTAASQDVRDEVESIVQEAGATEYRFVVGPWEKDYFRSKLWPAYKAHRRRCDAPVGLHIVKAKVVEMLGEHAIVAPSFLEADDVLGTLMTEPGFPLNCTERVLWSVDKDMKQIPGLYLDRETGKVEETTRLQGDYHHMLQTLTGDSSDGYPGCPGVGPVNAARLLDIDWTGWWAAVVGAFRKAKLTEEDALLQARVSRILRYGDKPGTWTPIGSE